MTDPFSQPVATSSGSDAKISDFVGRLLLLTPTEYVAEVTTVNGIKDAVRTSVVVLDGGQGVPAAPQEHNDMLVFQGRLISKLKGKVNSGKVLGRLVRQAATPGQQAPYDLLEFTPDDAAVARRYLETAPVAPVAAPF